MKRQRAQSPQQRPITKTKRLGQLATRVAVAKDVIAQLRAGKLKMKQGSGYMEWGSFSNLEGVDAWAVKQHFRHLKSCTVCAKGGFFVAYVSRFDGISGDDTCRMGSSGESTTLARIFGPVWTDSEAIFEGLEGDEYGGPAGVKLSLFLRANTIPKDAKERAIWIMRNIIQSGGKSAYPVRGKGR